MGYWIVTIEGLRYMYRVRYWLFTKGKLKCIYKEVDTPVGTLSIGRNPLETLFDKTGDMNLESYKCLFGYEELIPIQECLSLALQRMSNNTNIKADILNDRESGWEVGVISIPEECFPREWLGR
jgi:hypothetical protein